MTPPTPSSRESGSTSYSANTGSRSSGHMVSNRLRDADRPALGRAPVPLVVAAAIALAVLLVPVAALLIRAPWSDLPDHIASAAVLQALRLSLVTATLAAALSLVLGVPLAWMLARVSFRGRPIIRALVTVPLVLPPVVGGIALLMAFGRQGVVGEPAYEVFGLTIPFTMSAVVLAQTFVALPFLIISVEGALRSSDARYDEVAATLGASRWTTFRTITLPMTLPGVVSGLVWHGHARSASSGQRSPSPATSPARPGPCRWPSTPHDRQSRRRRSC